MRRKQSSREGDDVDGVVAESNADVRNEYEKQGDFVSHDVANCLGTPVE